MEKWLKKNLEECIEKVKYTTKIPRKRFQADGAFPIISQESEFINGFWDDEKDVFKVDVPLVIYGDHTQIFKFVDFDFVLGADGVKILQPKSFLEPKFFYFFLRSVELKHLGYARHYRLLKKIDIAFPESLAEQRKIVAELDKLSAETKMLKMINVNKSLALEELEKSLLREALHGAP